MKKITIIANQPEISIDESCGALSACLLSVCGQTLISRLVNQFWEYTDMFYIIAGENVYSIQSVLPQSNHIRILSPDNIVKSETFQMSDSFGEVSLVLDGDTVMTEQAVLHLVQNKHERKFPCLGDHISNIATFLLKYGFSPIAMDEEEAMRIETGQDYSCVLNDCNFTPVKEHFNPYVLHFHCGLQTFAGIYDVIGAKIARQYGMNGLYLGSYQISSAIGKKDDDSFSLDDSFAVARQVRHAGIDMPIILDGMSGIEASRDMDSFCKKIREYKIGGVIIDDIKDAHSCSLNMDFSPKLLTSTELYERIAFFKNHLDGHCMVAARTEILNITTDKSAIYCRLQDLEKSNADLVLPHYVGDDFTFLKSIMESWHCEKPRIIIPSRLLDITKHAWFTLGYQFLIYANVDLRLRSRQLGNVYEHINTKNTMDVPVADVDLLKQMYDFG